MKVLGILAQTRALRIPRKIALRRKYFCIYDGSVAQRFTQLVEPRLEAAVLLEDGQTTATNEREAAPPYLCV